MSTDTFKLLKLNNRDLDTRNIPVIVGANGTSLGAIGQITCELQIGDRKCETNIFSMSRITKKFNFGS